MCNKLHQHYDPIPETGIAYKVFSFGILGMASHALYKPDKDGWIRWHLQSKIHGFCMFLSKEEAERCSAKWGAFFPEEKPHVVAIEYDKGLGEFDEYKIFAPEHGPFRSALCQAFKIIP